MLPTIAQLASKHGIVPLKKYGQNFIFDETLCDKIVRASNLQKGDLALEVGPGPAGLTRSILKTQPQKLTVIETDIRFLPLLEEIKDVYPFLEIRHEDALKFNIADAVSDDRKLHIISNLPYNIGNVLLVKWLQQPTIVASMTLMLQKEVVDRITASVNTKAYGRLSIICQLLCSVEKCFDVSPNAFHPKPKVWSTIVKLIPKTITPDQALINKVQEITNHAFSGRRKMIKTSLKLLSPDIEAILNDLHLNSHIRAENLSPADYLLIATKLV